MAPTRSERAVALRESRTALLGRADIRGAALRAALSELYDAWLRELLVELSADGVVGSRTEVALVAVGGLGRCEPAPYGDLDLVLVHDGGPGVQELAKALWYPIWDGGVRLDHSVRSIPQVRAVAEHDAKAALGLLDARHIAGSQWLSESLRATGFEVWRAKAHTHVPTLAEAARLRERTAGELAFLLEPDLKESLGGIRDCLVLHALAAAQLVDEPGEAVRAARTLLLDVRGELHRRLGRGVDRLVQQEQPAVAQAVGAADADDLLRSVAAAGRTVRFASDTSWRTVDAELARRVRWRSRRRLDRRPLADGVVECGGEVMLARAAEPAWDPGLPLRAAAAAAAAGLPISPYTLRRFQRETPDPPLPWPDSLRDSLVRLLGAGPASIPVIEALDQHGLMSRLLPGWEEVRSRPQRNPVHRFTVDRHLVECAAEASALTRQVARPDLLLLAALLHDIGKGQQGDHSESGATIAAAVGARLGLPPEDVDVLTALVRHHLLLPHTATRRDPDDPATIASVVAAVSGSGDVLDLLHALCHADARATGPAAWSDWKAALVAGLVERVGAVLRGASPPAAPVLPEQARLAVRLDRPTITALSWPVEPGRCWDPARARLTGAAPASVAPASAASDSAASDSAGELLVVAPDTPGLLSRVAGLLAVHSLDVVTATVTTERAHAVNIFRVTARFGRMPDLDVVRADFSALVEGRFPLSARLAAAERAYPRVANTDARVLWFDAQANDATVVEVRSADSVGLLHRLTATLERCHLDVRSARISTLGGSVVDAFSVRTDTGGLLDDPELRRTVEQALLIAVSTDPEREREGVDAAAG
ncbi:MAG: [protein-PII] uridylyltransferase [Actinomycetota bacterium]|nr:[protein-PII] uridylyltransferase [Actinomycetota bacterium]